MLKNGEFLYFAGGFNTDYFTAEIFEVYGI